MFPFERKHILGVDKEAIDGCQDVILVSLTLYLNHLLSL